MTEYDAIIKRYYYVRTDTRVKAGSYDDAYDMVQDLIKEMPDPNLGLLLQLRRDNTWDEIKIEEKDQSYSIRVHIDSTINDKQITRKSDKETIAWLLDVQEAQQKKDDPNGKAN